MRLARLAPPEWLGSVALATLLALAPLKSPAPALAAPPSEEAQVLLRRGFRASSDPALLTSADSLLSRALAEWRRTGQSPDELAAILKQRASVRQRLGSLDAALDDLDESLTLATSPAASPAAAELQRTYVARARVHAALRQWKEAEADMSAAIGRLDELDAIEATNPFLFAERAEARARLLEPDWAGAAADAEQASAEFQAIGDKVRSLLAASSAALYEHGAGAVDESVGTMRLVFKKRGVPATNDPDQIGLLQELSRREAELHLAYAAHLFGEGPADAAGAPGSDRGGARAAAAPRRAAGGKEGGKESEATADAQWRMGCTRLRAYVGDGLRRAEEEAALRAEEARGAEEFGPGGAAPLRASSAGTPFGVFSVNSDLNARLNGIDPTSPYVTQRPQQGYTWYKLGEADEEVRDQGVALAEVDPRLSCDAFGDAAWTARERPDWPPELARAAARYVSASGAAAARP